MDRAAEKGRAVDRSSNMFGTLSLRVHLDPKDEGGDSGRAKETI